MYIYTLRLLTGGYLFLRSESHLALVGTNVSLLLETRTDLWWLSRWFLRFMMTILKNHRPDLGCIIMVLQNSKAQSWYIQPWFSKNLKKIKINHKTTSLLRFPSKPSRVLVITGTGDSLVLMFFKDMEAVVLLLWCNFKTLFDGSLKFI